ncbi:MAG TPA: hypothetical protein VHY32_11290 [Caulobacteraceae bacterium]|nr:hypothetical protein [Caulobacteraceae bacterium]
MKRSHLHDFHFHEAPIVAFLTAFVLLIIAASVACEVAPWQ